MTFLTRSLAIASCIAAIAAAATAAPTPGPTSAPASQPAEWKLPQGVVPVGALDVSQDGRWIAFRPAKFDKAPPTSQPKGQQEAMYLLDTTTGKLIDSYKLLAGQKLLDDTLARFGDLSPDGKYLVIRTERPQLIDKQVHLRPDALYVVELPAMTARKIAIKEFQWSRWSSGKLLLGPGEQEGGKIKCQVIDVGRGTVASAEMPGLMLNCTPNAEMFVVAGFLPDPANPKQSIKAVGLATKDGKVWKTLAAMKEFLPVITLSPTGKYVALDQKEMKGMEMARARLQVFDAQGSGVRDIEDAGEPCALLDNGDLFCIRFGGHPTLVGFPKNGKPVELAKGCSAAAVVGAKLYYAVDNDSGQFVIRTMPLPKFDAKEAGK